MKKLIVIGLILFLSCNENKKNTNSVSNNTDTCKQTTIISDSIDTSVVSDSTYYADLELDSVSYKLKKGYNLYIYPINNKREMKVRLTGNNLDVSLTPCDSCGWSTGTPKFIPCFEKIDFDDYFVISSGGYWYIYKKVNGELLLGSLFEVVGGTYDTKNNLILYRSPEGDITLLDLKNLKKVINFYDNETNTRYQYAYAFYFFKITKVTEKYVVLTYAPNDGMKPLTIRILKTAFK